MTALNYKRLFMALLFGSMLTLGACSGEDTNPQTQLTDTAQEAPAEMQSATGDDAMPASSDNPVVVMETSMGIIEIELWPEEAPLSVENFLRYVDNSLYDNLTFHRVIPGFMIQGGGYDSDFVELSGYPAIKNEARPALRNDRGTIAMARTQVVDSATSQFFINLVDNEFLNQRGTSPQEFGYAVFGEVISGMDVVDQIAGVQTTSRRGHQDVPVEAVTIVSATRR
ncbi:peptidylprolyl isomerase [Pseudohongiella spirulinae]|uniref:Peptidyl-prolyl cis-trans isomerase n=2 Tax=Pseudohongiella spirulinae TaxID=1249552 RepID=A0A0S2KDM1_9GAMM|nr:peptidylprolyl isomerase [Pseudohongiella spirulinae]